MTSTTDPESMTAEERRLEVASILARGLLRRVCNGKTAAAPPDENPLKQRRIGLELSPKLRLSVAPRPAG